MNEQIHHITIGNVSFRLTGHESILMLNLLEKNEWEIETFRILRQYLSPERIYLDLGAFLGAMAIYAAHFARHCYAVEPNPLIFPYLLRNVELNSPVRQKITCVEGCISDRNGFVELRAPVKPYGSAATIMDEQSVERWLVHAMTFEEFVDSYAVMNVGFIKVDIEGAECLVIPEMHGFLLKHRPTLFLSLHYRRYPNPKQDIGRILDSLSHYRFVYLRDGALADVNAIRAGCDLNTHLSKNSDLLATDIEWRR